MDVVEHEHERVVSATKRLAKPRDDDVFEVRTRRSQGCENAVVERLDLIERGGDRTHQEHRVVVTIVQRDPAERPLIGMIPLRENRGLAVARGRRQQGNRCPNVLGAARYDLFATNELPLREMRTASPV